jgi:[acyl-carrier-protein] S-malonyltransferase
MAPAAERLAGDVMRVPLKDLDVPIINNADAKPLMEAMQVRQSLIRQLASAVLWEDSVRVLRDMGVTTLIEIGPGTVLSGLAKRIAPELRLLNVQDPASLSSTVEALAA